MIEEKNLSRKASRRAFLKGASYVGAAGVLAACSAAPAASTPMPAPTCPPAPTAAPAPTCPPAPTAVPQPTAAPAAAPATWDKSAEVVIIGAGGAGLAAAIEATDAGAKVLVLDKGNSAGGTTAVSGGIIQAAGTKWQKEIAKVMDDTPAKHLEYWVEASEGLADPALLKLMADNAPGNLEWMAKQGANYVGMSGVNHIPYITAPGLMVDRIHASAKADGKPGNGGDHIRVLVATAKSKNIEMMFKTEAVSLVYDADKGVVGVIAQADGKTLRVQATKAVILATSSFDQNKDMARQFSPQQYWALNTGTCLCIKGSTGDGIRMAMAVGANLAGMGGTIGYLGTAIGTGSLADVPGIWVNKYGQRFVDENGHYAYVMRSVFQQEEHIAWAVFDEATKAKGGKTLGGIFGAWSDDLSKEITAGTIKSGKTPAELAKAAGINEAQLVATLTAWNADVAGGKDSMFGKTAGLKPFGDGPFYAVQVHEANLGSLGGVKINPTAQVLDVADKPIAHLYAAGTICGNIYGPYYPGSGTAIQSTLTFGRIAGKAAAAEKALA